MQVMRLSDEPEKGLQNVALLLVPTTHMIPNNLSPYSVSHLEVQVIGSLLSREVLV